MENLETDEQCDRCKGPFKILVRDFEQAMKDGDPILCPKCETKALEEEMETEKPLKQCFEYSIVPIKGCNLIEFGKNGWELVTIYDGIAYFKRERFEDI